MTNALTIEKQTHQACLECDSYDSTSQGTSGEGTSPATDVVVLGYVRAWGKSDEAGVLLDR